MSTLTIGPAFRPIYAPARRRSRRSTVRLTRRGRVVVLLAALVVAFAVGVLAAGSVVATGEAGRPEATKVMTVGSGDTLWAIASDLADDGDVRAMMQEIERLNTIEGGVLIAGQKLVVPAP
jgi:LysM repeat protein